MARPLREWRGLTTFLLLVLASGIAGPAPGAAAASAEGLRVTELMFHAPGGATNDFLELYNAGDSALALGGAKFTQGIDFAFPAGTTLPPKGYVLLTRAPATGNFAGFRAVYGLNSSVPIYGPYAGNFSDAGESVVLRDGAGAVDLVAFTYGDGRGWPVSADGAGHSLVPRADFGSATNGVLDFGGNWRASATIGGSPGRADPEPDTAIVLNEVVAHTDFLSEFDSNDWVELYNRSAAAVTLGAGWYLSDDSENPRKWQLPASTVIPSHGWVVFDEVTGFNNPRGTGFSLNKEGEAVYLSHFVTGQAGRVVDAVSFKGQENEWALARVPDGGDFWDQVIPRTPGRANAALLPRVVISELLYHEGGLPTNRVAAQYLEFLEIHNATGQRVELFNTNAVWRLTGGVTFDFPLATILNPGERTLVVSFDPVANPAVLTGFRAALQVPNTVRILGPYSGRLANDSDRVALERAQAPDVAGDAISWVIVDEVTYSDRSPWPGGADGQGTSYQRRSATVPGSDPANWLAAAPTPGAAPPDAATDTDGDGMSDAWEVRYGLLAGDPSDATLDPDRDGLTNRDEYQAGTDPRDAGSSLKLAAAWDAATASVALSFTAVAGRGYVVEERDLAASAGWTTIRDVPAASETRTVNVTVMVGARAGGRLQRVRLP